MDGTRQLLKVPSVAVIVEINRMFIEDSGEEFIGSDNLLYRTSLDYILAEIQTIRFGEDRFSSLFDKAAAIAERIIVNHIFCGANKRTGLLACVTFLELNGYDMQIYDGDRFDEEAIQVALAFQEKQMSLEEFTDLDTSKDYPSKAPNALTAHVYAAVYRHGCAGDEAGQVA